VPLDLTVRVPGDLSPDNPNAWPLGFTERLPDIPFEKVQIESITGWHNPRTNNFPPLRIWNTYYTGVLDSFVLAQHILYTSRIYGDPTRHDPV
jgi:hypothetical protein